jgi:DNA-directed RNA polymerase sigma subunit (sigma70/sigma32)
MPAAAVCLPVAVFGVSTEEFPAEDDDPADEAERRVLLQSLHAALRDLYHVRELQDRRAAAVVVRHFGIGCNPASLRDIADELGVSVRTAWKLERRGLAQLRVAFSTQEQA